jgi:hypothetical protein
MCVPRLEAAPANKSIENPPECSFTDCVASMTGILHTLINIDHFLRFVGIVPLYKGGKVLFAFNSLLS